MVVSDCGSRAARRDGSATVRHPAAGFWHALTGRLAAWSTRRTVPTPTPILRAICRSDRPCAQCRHLITPEHPGAAYSLSRTCAMVPRIFQSGGHPFADNAPLQLSHGRNDSEHGAAHRRRGIPAPLGATRNRFLTLETLRGPGSVGWCFWQTDQNAKPQPRRICRAGHRPSRHPDRAAVLSRRFLDLNKSGRRSIPAARTAGVLVKCDGITVAGDHRLAPWLPSAPIQRPSLLALASSKVYWPRARASRAR